jgi:hypothetical protein
MQSHWNVVLFAYLAIYKFCVIVIFLLLVYYWYISKFGGQYKDKVFM